MTSGISNVSDISEKKAKYPLGKLIYFQIPACYLGTSAKLEFKYPASFANEKAWIQKFVLIPYSKPQPEKLQTLHS